MKVDDRRKINVAIDGPAGAGKSTIARLVANALNYIYVDTGAMYRVIALKALQANITEPSDIARLADQLDIELVPHQEEQKVLVDGADVTEAIRASEVSSYVSQVAQIAHVRKRLVTKQQAIAAHKGVVMDGRDIATHVIPDAELKIYLTASVQERARRRYKQMNSPDTTLAELEQAIATRDEMDMQREHSPLVVADDAIVIDGTQMTIEQVVDHILKLCRTKLGGEQ